MTLEEITQRVRQIERSQGDPEAAHSREDELRADFIKHLAENAPEPIASMAAKIYSTENMNFARWCA